MKIDLNKKLAVALAQIKVPAVMMIGGSGAGAATEQDALMKNLINLRLMDATGIFEKTNIDNSTVQRTIARNSGIPEK